MTPVTIARSIIASAQDHSAEVMQATSGKKLILAGGSRGYYLNKVIIQRYPTSLQEIQLLTSITASAQDHTTEVMQATSGKSMILSTGMRGRWIDLWAIVPGSGGKRPVITVGGPITVVVIKPTVQPLLFFLG